MSSDQLLASLEGAASAGIARDEVVVPLRAPSPIGSAAPRLGHAAGSHTSMRAVVAQITDYFHRERRHAVPEASALRPPLRAAARPRSAAALPAAVAAHAEELDRLLRQHIERHLDLIETHAPDLAQPIDNVRRSVELLLKLRRR